MAIIPLKINGGVIAMKHFIRKYKAEILLGACALAAGTMSFVITLNITTKHNKAREISDVMQNENVIAENMHNELYGENYTPYMDEIGIDADDENISEKEETTSEQ